MTTIIKLIIASVLALVMTSCNFSLGIHGNGYVTTEERTLSGTFDEIEVSRGLDVYLTQSDSEQITVQADGNLHDIIITEIEGNVLKITTDKNISYSEAQKVMVSFKNLSKITTSSGSDVYASNTINLDELTLVAESGSDLNLNLNVQTINCQASSGSDIELSGTTRHLFAEASSGSDIDASKLEAEISHVKATSGADIIVNSSNELYAKATSGGNVNYYGNPSKVEASDNVSGNINAI